jgi:rhamnose transport system permease protein
MITDPTTAAAVNADAGSDPWWRPLIRWEAGLVVVFALVVVYGAVESSVFLTQNTVFFFGIDIGQVAIMALPLTLIIMTGEIDLSVAAMLGLSCSLLGYLFEHGVEIWLAMIICLAVGAVGGALNGALVTRLGLPSIAVTIGTLTMFRGIAEIILGSSSVTGFPAYLTKIGVSPVTGTKISYGFAIFIVLAVVYAIVTHATPVGRSIYAIGLQEEAAFFSGIRVKRIKFTLYVLSGVVCAFVGILYTFENATSRYDAGTGLELNVVAVVLFGGVSIFGGRGSIGGVVLSVLIVGSLGEILTQTNVSAEAQNMIIGILLLISVLVPNGADGLRRIRARARRLRGHPHQPTSGATSTARSLPPAGPAPPG